MKKINISENIADLRKKKGITQEQLAAALNVSPQAVSKWETNISQPDVHTLPCIADFFGVSIDYLFYGEDISYDDIYEKIFRKVSAHGQMSKESYEDTLKIFGYAHNGITKGNLRDKSGRFYDEPSHISDKNGVSLLSGKGYGAIITRSFFENISRKTANFAADFLSALSEKNNFLVCMAIISMSDISYQELKEKLGFDDESLHQALNRLIEVKIVVEKESKHKSLGFTYEIADMYHTCMCVLVATIEMQRYSLEGMSCCMGYGDYPVNCNIVDTIKKQR